MSVPRMNWKKFISTGLLVARIPEQTTNQNNSKEQKVVATKNIRSARKTTFKNYIAELERVVMQNDALIAAIDNEKNPFHLLARDFIETQLYDSKVLFAECEKRVTRLQEKTRKADAQKKLKKLAKHISQFEKCRGLIEK